MLPQTLGSRSGFDAMRYRSAQKAYQNPFLPDSDFPARHAKDFPSFPKPFSIRPFSYQPITGTYIILMRPEALKNSSLSTSRQRIPPPRRRILPVHSRSVFAKVSVVLQRLLLVACALSGPRVVAVMYLVSTSTPRWSSRAWNSTL